MLKSPYLALFKDRYRFVRGGFLRHPQNNFVFDVRKTEVAGSRLNRHIIDSLNIVWSVAWSSNHGGNEVAIAKDSQLLSVGGGPSTVEAASAAVIKAQECGHNLENSVFAANAFFPFIDAPEILANAGLRVGIVPEGGKRESLVKKFFHEKRITMVYLPERYRGFSRH